jgi:acyl-CoA thioesterase-1
MTTFRNCFVLLLWLVFAGCAGQSSSDESGVIPLTGEASELPGDSQESDVGDERIIVFLGDSITAGYGVDNSESFPEVARNYLIERGFDVQIRNAGVSGETSAGGLRRIDWVLRQRVDILVVELGGNDGLRGVPVTETSSNLEAIVRKARESHPEVEVVIAGMQLPPNMGADYVNAFSAIFPRIASQNDAHLIPFILKGVGGVPELNQRDGIHPTAEGHTIIAGTVVDALVPILQELD